MTTWNLDFGIPVGLTTIQNAFSAYNSNGTSINVLLGGTPIPLSTINYNNGFTFTTGQTNITVNNTGTYFIQYNIRTTASLLMSSTITRNGTQSNRLICSPGLASSNYSGTALIALTTNDVLSLIFYGLLGTAVLANGVGASINIIRII